MSVELITEDLEKVQLAYELPASPNTEVLEQDSKIFELIRLLAEYEALANDQFRVHFADGFLDLSRANYNGSRKHGIDSFDLRPYNACTVLDGTGEIIDRLQIQREGEKRRRERAVRENQEKEKEGKRVDGEGKSDKNGENGESDGRTKVDEKLEAEQKNTQSATAVRRKPVSGELRNRKNRKEPAEEQQSYKDPINQFGGLVPYQLWSSQSHFKRALVDCVRMVKLQRKIELLMEEIGGK